MPLERKRELIEPEHLILSVARQCELLGLPRSSWYYKPQEVARDDLELMRRIDEQYTLTPFYGIRRMTVSLHQQGHRVNHKRVQRLMRFMGIEAIYPKESGKNNLYIWLIHIKSKNRLQADAMVHNIWFA